MTPTSATRGDPLQRKLLTLRRHKAALGRQRPAKPPDKPPTPMRAVGDIHAPRARLDQNKTHTQGTRSTGTGLRACRAMKQGCVQLQLCIGALRLEVLLEPKCNNS
mmetsp:Transcript_66743/g.186068  ORF Transcript_66743/g.186068 Transcript_66743/m.186068 type:complete len:106 (+) Transcript_66743:1119-1436(+)